MSYILAIAQLSFIVYILFREYKRKSVSIFLWTMLFIIFGAKHCLNVFSGLKEYPIWVYDNASLFVICFCIIYLFIRTLFTRPPINLREVNGNDISNKYFCITISILFGAIAFSTFSLARSSGGLLNASWGSHRDLISSTGIQAQICTFLYNFACSSLLIALFAKKRRISIILIGIILFYTIVIKQRAAILPLFVCVIAYYIYRGDIPFRKKIVFYFIAGLTSVFVIYAIQSFRYYGSIINFVSEYDSKIFYTQIITRINDGEGDLGLSDVFYYFILHNNNFENFGQAHTYLRMLLIFIPTSLALGIKPPDFAISMGTALGTGLEGFSTHPTLFGDCYANLGWAGIFLGAFWALFISYMDSLISSQNKIYIKICMIAICANSYIIIGRGSVYNAFTWMIYGIILTYVIQWISKVVVKR